ncbi:MAG: acetyl-CoA carboxylase biotin carboxyl carrier protein subunit [Flavobacteriaceae bacterium]|nr:acetyl-CoA carboxylase biotin carboxyl carrier protein subunit [Flavobacteriaceae bacterium]
MSNSYKASVNKKYNFEFSAEDLNSLDIKPTNTSHLHVLKDNLPFKAKILKGDFQNREYEIRVKKSKYNVVITDDLDALIKEMGFSLGNAKQLNNLKAPMPGLILEINVEPGQEVKEGDSLLILSAMKMENNFTSSRDGIIKSVHVKKDDAIEKGQLLIEFEA